MLTLVLFTTRDAASFTVVALRHIPSGGGPASSKTAPCHFRFHCVFFTVFPACRFQSLSWLSPLPVSASRLFLAFRSGPRLSQVVSPASLFLTLPVSFWFREPSRPGMNKHNPGVRQPQKGVPRPFRSLSVAPRLGKPTRARGSPSREFSSPVLSFPVFPLLDISGPSQGLGWEGVGE